MSLASDFKCRFSEFTAPDVDKFVLIYEPELLQYYGSPYDPANDATREIILNLLAHLIMLELRRAKTPVRNVSSRSVGGVSTSYEAGGAMDVQHAFFSTTAYGQRFLLLTASNCGPRPA